MSLVKNYEDEEGLHFIIRNIHVSLANAIRRTILSDIPIVVIRTETQEINECTITVNTSRFHNEIVKQRLSCIPIHIGDINALNDFVENHRLVVDVKNETNHEMRWATTDDFRIQHKQNEQYLEETSVRKIFPHDVITNQPIDFLRLRPMIGTGVDGEHIQLTADFSISNAKENGMFNVVSKCAFHNVIDPEVREDTWAIQLQALKDEGRSEEEIEFEKKNFKFLDAQRCYKKDAQGEANEFEFIIQSIGIYPNYEIVYYACDILERKFRRFIQDIQSQIVPIHSSLESRDLGYTSITVSSIENSFDVILEEEDYTMGYLLERSLYTLFYYPDGDEKGTLLDKEENEDQEAPIGYTGEKRNAMVFIGFKKYHPHDDYSVIRMAFKEPSNALLLTKQYLVQAATEVADNVSNIKKLFTPFLIQKPI